MSNNLRLGVHYKYNLHQLVRMRERRTKAGQPGAAAKLDQTIQARQHVRYRNSIPKKAQRELGLLPPAPVGLANRQEASC